MKNLFVAAVLFLVAVCRAATPETSTNVFEEPTAPIPESELDKIVFTKLNQLGVQPVLCSDAVFVRRVYLDVLGTLPTATEAREFIEDPDKQNKRRLLIDRLLERDEYADYWAMKWGDILRIKAEFPVNLWPNAAQAYHRWVRASLAENKTYDKFVREMLTASGSNFRVGPVNFYRAVQNRTAEGIAGAVALAFMGARVDAWPTNRFREMTVFFSQIGYKPTSEWKEEHVFWDPIGASKTAGNTAPGRASVTEIALGTNAPVETTVAWTNPFPINAVFPDGSKVKLTGDRDPREVFADWLIRPWNPWFTRSIVNRVWGWLLGRGIIHEPDNIRDDNPPSNPALLSYLEKEMIAGNYDLKRLYRLILNSQTYQLSSLPRQNTPEAAANFASYTVRRMDAEVLSDAINKITGSSDLYTSPIPEPFTYIPKGMPAVTIADGSITSPFLALFGRSARATGMENERNNKPTPAQWLYLLNSSEVQSKLEQGPNLPALVGGGRRRTSQIAEDLYLTILSRFPTEAELRVVEDYGRKEPAKPAAAPTNSPAGTIASTNASSASATNAVAASANTNQPRRGPLGNLGLPSRRADRQQVVKKREEWIDIAWSLINSEEFLYRH